MRAFLIDVAAYSAEANWLSFCPTSSQLECYKLCRVYTVSTAQGLVNSRAATYFADRVQFCRLSASDAPPGHWEGPESSSSRRFLASMSQTASWRPFSVHTSPASARAPHTHRTLPAASIHTTARGAPKKRCPI